MVRRLLILALGVTPLMGCLLSNPPDYDELEQLPVITVSVPLSELVFIDLEDTETRNTDFSVDIVVSEDEPNLRQRWLQDFQASGFPNNQVTPDDTTRRNSDGSQTAAYRLDHRTLTLNKCNRLSVALTDGEWDESPTALSKVSVVEGAHRMIKNWWIFPTDSTSGGIDSDDCRPLTGLAL